MLSLIKAMRKSTIWSRNNDPNILQMTEVQLTGLLFSNLIIFAFSHFLGTILSCIDKLNAVASGTLILSTIYSNSFGDPVRTW